MKNKNYIQMKKSFFLLFFLFCTFLGFAQAGLQVQSNARGMYVTHTVNAKENFYSIGRLYAISPKDIAAFNAVDMAKGLSVGQTIMIPLNATNFSQKDAKGVPVYYVVGGSEGLYRVSVKNNNVLMANLRKWNSLTSDNISAGQKLVVGYIVSQELKNHTAAAPKTESPAIQPQQPVKEEVTQPVTVQTQKQPEPQKPQPTTEAKNVAVTTGKAPAAIGGAGYFKKQFEAQSKSAAAGREITATSGIFKTASGWQDAKYYALMDRVEPGTIIQVVNPSNNKAVYAKVLGEMSGIRQNQGLELRISNAAASALGITDSEKFIVNVNY
jgi:LysM repeat protein